MAKIILVLLALTASTFGQQCGQSPQMRPNRRYDPEGQRIVGGVEARPGSHPWIVSLQQGESHFCGGTLIAPNVVITAAHCVADGAPDRIVAGAHDHYSSLNKNVQISRPARVQHHQRYNDVTTMNDIAVITLAKPFTINAFVQPACLPEPGETVADGTVGTVAGWGLTREGGYDTSSILMQVGIPAMPHASCARQYSSQGIAIDQNAMLCGGYPQGGKDSCQGDSGGPFVFKGTKGYTLHGVVSFGIGCARAGSPGVYAKVVSYLPWIKQTVTNLSG